MTRYLNQEQYNPLEVLIGLVLLLLIALAYFFADAIDGPNPQTCHLSNTRPVDPEVVVIQLDEFLYRACVSGK